MPSRIGHRDDRPVIKFPAKLTVMRDDDDPCFRELQGLDELVNQCHGQMVGWLVQEQAMGSRCQGQGEVQASLLTDRQLRHRS